LFLHFPTFVEKNWNKKERKKERKRERENIYLKFNNNNNNNDAILKQQWNKSAKFTTTIYNKIELKNIIFAVFALFLYNNNNLRIVSNIYVFESFSFVVTKKGLLTTTKRNELEIKS
jgi:hypothetical protein